MCVVCVCSSVLQCVAVCGSVWQRVAAYWQIGRLTTRVKMCVVYVCVCLWCFCVIVFCGLVRELCL